MQRSFLCAFFAFMVVLAPMSARPTQAADQPSPVAFVQTLGDKAISILGDKSLSKDQANQAFHQMLQEAFDLPTIGRFVLGRTWNGITPEQRQEYLTLFDRMVIKTYSDRFALYAGETFQAKASRAEGDKDFIVSSIIIHPNGSTPTNVDWRVRQKDGKLGIIDVIIEGVGMSVTQHQEFAAIIQRNGGTIDPLLADMRQRAQ